MAKTTKKPEDLSIREILRGCEPGRIQSVGYMQVIPLVSDVVDERFAAPTHAQIKTSDYGTLVIKNQADDPMIVPAHTAYVVKQSAQDHALPHAGVVEAKAQKAYRTAMCVQQTQGGLIKGTGADQSMVILPFSLREPAHKTRKTTDDYSRLWPAIAAFNKKVGVRQTSSHLDYFLDQFKKELDRFVAEFEPVPRQIGAIILIGGKIAGIERAPNHSFWLSIWRPLIRECYGSLAILAAKEHGEEAPVPKTRVMLKKARSIATLRSALKDAIDQEYNQVKAIVDRIVGGTVSRVVDERVNDISIDALENQQFVGQVVCDGDQVVYASMITREQWMKHQDWYEADSFKM